MNFKKTWLAVPAVLALTLTACSGGAGSTDQSSAAGAAGSAELIRVWGGEPQNPLIPANTNETAGGRVADALFAGLTYYTADGSTELEVAESIESEDNITWTIKLKEGQKFSDGTPVLAKNFVDAWIVAGAEKMLNIYFFEPIVGYDDKGENHDLAQGLKIVDDLTFTVTLKQPEADFPSRLGYTAFFPLPDASLADLEAAGEHPIGNGPYMMAGKDAWEHNVKIDVVPNPEYKGGRMPKNAGISFVVYSGLDAAYADLTGGNLDVLDGIPDSAFATYESDLEGRSVNQAAAVFQSICIPQNAKHFSGEEGKLRRQAISMAINRDEITQAIFQGTRSPAKDFTSPVVDGYNDKVPGAEVLNFQPEKAKELWAKADAISPYEGTFTLAYNADGGHQAWADAVVNNIKNNLGIQAEGKAYPDFKSFRNDITERRIEGAFRTGWQGDYPSKYNFLAPIYGTGAGSNDGDYSSAEFDQLLRDAAAAPSIDEANKVLDKAQEVLLADLPVIPTWYANVNGGWSDSVENVVFNWKSLPEYHNITKK